MRTPAIAVEWRRRPGRICRWDAIAAAGFFAWAVAWLWPLLPKLQAIWPRCHFRHFTGLPCGTCGFTRAFVHGARLEIDAALEASPLGTVLFFGWMLASLWIACTWIAPKLRFPRLRLPSLLTRFGPLAAFVANWAWLVWQEAGR